MRKHWTLSEICSKNLKICKFSFTPCWEEVTWQLPRAAKAMIFLRKLANRILISRSKNHMHIKFRYFSRKNLATGGWNHPHQMPLTVKSFLWDALSEDFMSPQVLTFGCHFGEAVFILVITVLWKVWETSRYTDSDWKLSDANKQKSIHGWKFRDV